jgi:hypothetical protein
MALAVLLLAPALQAQGLPSYRPINPVAASRSGLGFDPFHVPVPGRWQVDMGLEYASTIESNQTSAATFLLDSELFRTRARVYRDLSERTFLVAEAEVLGAYGGVLDGFLEWYHELLNIEIPERERRPKNDFLYAGELADGNTVQRRSGALFLGDMRLGAGFRVHRQLQTVVALTLPTNTGPPGYGKDVVSASLLNTLSLPLGSRVLLEAGLGGGYTPATGSLASLQRELFAAGNAGLRWRFWGRQSLYGNLFAHTPYYHDTGASALDQRDLSFDFGWILAGDRGREVRVGLTEDLEPQGPAVDLVLRIGVRL